MTTIAADHSVDELMTAVLASEIKDGDIGMPTAMCPLADTAICLAKLTNAKGMVWQPHGGPDPLDVYDLAHLNSSPRGRNAAMFIPDWGDVVAQMTRSMVGFQIVAPAQIDKYGNMNNNVIGDHAKPTVRFPGSVGMPEIGVYHQKVLIYEPRHTARVFVEKVDFISGLGQGFGGQKGRRQKGISGGGPIIVVSNLAVMDFDEDSGLMKIRSLHPGVELAEVQASTGFELLGGESIPITDAPTAEQVDLIRNVIDPEGRRRHRM
ncbi:MAG TPA: CoA-transferase [Pseudomonadales bacterium]|jgi:glutaconate CoA-transferase subunit B|nr:CoA-transferase [Pseudomonadales bacterium]